MKKPIINTTEKYLKNGQIALQFEGGFDHIVLEQDDEDTFAFSINIAPENGMGLEQLSCYAKYIKWVEDVIRLFMYYGGKEHDIYIKDDFYWREQDLLLRVNIPRNHPLIKDGVDDLDEYFSKP